MILESNQPLDASAFRDGVAEAIVHAARRQGGRRADRVLRLMEPSDRRFGRRFRDWRREAVVTSVVRELHEAGAATTTSDGVRAEISLDEIVSFIERIMPLIVMLIDLFGG